MGRAWSFERRAELSPRSVLPCSSTFLNKDGAGVSPTKRCNFFSADVGLRKGVALNMDRSCRCGSLAPCASGHRLDKACQHARCFPTKLSGAQCLVLGHVHWSRHTANDTRRARRKSREIRSSHVPSVSCCCSPSCAALGFNCLYRIPRNVTFASRFRYEYSDPGNRVSGPPSKPSKTRARLQGASG